MCLHKKVFRNGKVCVYKEFTRFCLQRALNKVNLYFPLGMGGLKNIHYAYYGLTAKITPFLLVCLFLIFMETTVTQNNEENPKLSTLN